MESVLVTALSNDVSSLQTRGILLIMMIIIMIGIAAAFVFWAKLGVKRRTSKEMLDGSDLGYDNVPVPSKHVDSQYSEWQKELYSKDEW